MQDCGGQTLGKRWANLANRKKNVKTLSNPSKRPQTKKVTENLKQFMQLKTKTSQEHVESMLKPVRAKRYLRPAPNDTRRQYFNMGH